MVRVAEFHLDRRWIQLDEGESDGLKRLERDGLVTRRNADGKWLSTITHSSVGRRWRALSDLLLAESAFQSVWWMTDTRCHAWLRSRRRALRLLRGPELEDAEKLLLSPPVLPIPLSPAMRLFLVSSRRYRKINRIFKWTGLASAAAIVLALLCVGAFYAYNQSRLLNSSSDTNPVSRLDVASRSWMPWPVRMQEAPVWKAYEAIRPANWYNGGSAVFATAISSDGSLVVFGDQRGSFGAWWPEDDWLPFKGEQRPSISLGKQVRSAAISVDGTIAAAGTVDGRIQIAAPERKKNDQGQFEHGFGRRKISSYLMVR